MEKPLHEMILNDEISWEGMIREIVYKEGIDPWDVDVSKLSQAYLKKIKEFKELNFPFSGKVILIAAILLKLKARTFKFVEEEDEEEEFGQGIFDDLVIGVDHLEPNIPLPKTRKVTLDELIQALDAALKVERRKVERRKRREFLKKHNDFVLRVEKSNIKDRMLHLFKRIKDFFKEQKKLFFTHLVPSNTRNDIIATFIPLINLSNKGKVELFQERCFEDFEIIIRDEDETSLEGG